MTHRYIPPRDQKLAVSVIAEAERRRRESEARAALPERERCPQCGEPLSGNCEVRDEHYPFCSVRCSLEAEVVE